MDPTTPEPKQKAKPVEKPKRKRKKQKSRAVPRKKPEPIVPEQKAVEPPRKKRCGFCGSEIMWASMHPGGKFKCPKCERVGPESYFPLI